MIRFDGSELARWIVGTESTTVHITTRSLARAAGADTIACACTAVLRLPPSPPRLTDRYALCRACFDVWAAEGTATGWTSTSSAYQSWLTHAVTS